MSQDDSSVPRPGTDLMHAICCGGDQRKAHRVRVACHLVQWPASAPTASCTTVAGPDPVSHRACRSSSAWQSRLSRRPTPRYCGTPRRVASNIQGASFSSTVTAPEAAFGRLGSCRRRAVVCAYTVVNVDPPPLGAALALTVVDRDGPRCSANRNCYHFPSPSIAPRSLTCPRRSIRSLEPSSRDGPCLLSCGRWLSAVNIESRRVPWSRPSVSVDRSVQRRSRSASLSQLHPDSQRFGELQRAVNEARRR